MIHEPSSRRDVLRHFAALGAAAPFATNLAAVGCAAATTATSDYKALVCVFLQGGNDSNSLLLATDQDSWGRYWAARSGGTGPIALMPPGTPKAAPGQRSAVAARTVSAPDDPAAWGGVLPVTPRTPQPIPAGTASAGARTFAVHPLMPETQALFKSGRLAALANVGTLLTPLTKAQYLAAGRAGGTIPPRLFSHNDQLSAWQSGDVEGATAGWGGELGDALEAGNRPGADFTVVTTTGATIFPSGVRVKSYRIGVGPKGASAATIESLQRGGGPTGSPAFRQAMAETLTTSAIGNDLGADYVDAVRHSASTAKVFNAAMAQVSVPPPPPWVDPLIGKPAANGLADQLHAVATTIAARSVLGVKRQVFYVQLGGFDTHLGQNPRQAVLLAQLDHALAWFDGAMQAMGLGDKVTAFTASDFSRTFTANGDGTDHGWGGHHLIVGGAVRGGEIYGQYPTLGVDGKSGFQNPDAVRNALIPTTAVDQYLATLGAWLGVDGAQSHAIFPRLAGFSKANLGFMAT